MHQFPLLHWESKVTRVSKVFLFPEDCAPHPRLVQFFTAIEHVSRDTFGSEVINLFISRSPQHNWRNSVKLFSQHHTDFQSNLIQFQFNSQESVISTITLKTTTDLQTFFYLFFLAYLRFSSQMPANTMMRVKEILGVTVSREKY